MSEIDDKLKEARRRVAECVAALAAAELELEYARKRVKLLIPEWERSGRFHDLFV